MANKRGNMKTETFWHPATMMPQEARSKLKRKFPKAKIASFELSKDGKFYIAKLITSEFPPKKDDGPDDDDLPAPDNDEPDDDVDDDGGSPFPPKKKAPEGGNKVEHEILDVLHQILDALGGGPLSGGPLGAPKPPSGPSKPPGPPVEKAPPVEPPVKPGLNPPFASVQDQQKLAKLREAVKGRRTFSCIIRAGKEVSLRDAVTQAQMMYPDFEPRDAQRRTGRINHGKRENLIVVPMRRR